MSLRTMERLLIASSLLLGVAATGCGDDDDPPGEGGMDAGRDAGSDARADTGGGGSDSGSDTGNGGPSITCGENTCTGAVIANIDVQPCCVPDTDACGLDAEDIQRANSESPFTGCVPKDVPSAHDSTYCGAFFDQIEPEGGDRTNGGLDIKTGNRYAVFEGCCLPTGECGADITVPRGAAEEVNSHLGCVSFGRLRDAFEAQGEEPAETPANLPFCNPENGEAPTTGTVPGVAKFVCGCGEGNVYTEGEGFPCLNNLPPAVCGSIDPTEEELAAIPEFMCGCTANSKLPCLRNLDAATCGTKAIDANSPELMAIPEFICGCTADSKLPCMQNVDAAVCGGKPITDDSAELNDLPVFICGAVGGAPTSLPTMANVETAICGKKPITEDSAELNDLPEFMCGALGNPDVTSLPKLRNVAATICGKVPVTANSPFLADVPEFTCGCTGRNDPKLGCLRNVESDVCGATPIASDSPYLAAVPRFVCGCGETTLDTELGRLCMGNVETTTCGTKDATVNDRGTPESPADDCLVGVPEYARGCGDDEETPTGSSCLRRTPQLFGCDNVTSGPVLRIPEYLCGCGEAKPVGAGTGDASLPCLPFVLETICGAIPITASQQVAPIPNVVCGCGDGVTTQAAPCLDNVPFSVCGSQAMCVLGQTGLAAGCDEGEVCVDELGGPNSAGGGVNGDGDGIADTCDTP